MESTLQNQNLGVKLNTGGRRRHRLELIRWYFYIEYKLKWASKKSTFKYCPRSSNTVIMNHGWLMPVNVSLRRVRFTWNNSISYRIRSSRGKGIVIQSLKIHRQLDNVLPTKYDARCETLLWFVWVCFVRGYFNRFAAYSRDSFTGIFQGLLLLTWINSDLRVNFAYAYDQT